MVALYDLGHGFSVHFMFHSFESKAKLLIIFQHGESNAQNMSSPHNRLSAHVASWLHMILIFILFFTYRTPGYALHYQQIDKPCLYWRSLLILCILWFINFVKSRFWDTMCAVIHKNVLSARPSTAIDYTLGEMAVPYGGTDAFVHMMEIFMIPGKSYY